MPGWRLEKTRAGVARGIQFLLSASPPRPAPPSPPVRVVHESQPSAQSWCIFEAEVARWLFTGARVLPPFISHYEDRARWNPAWKARTHCSPLRLSPLWPLHSFTARWYRSGVRSPERGRSFHFSRFDPTWMMKSNLRNLSGGGSRSCNCLRKLGEIAYNSVLQLYIGSKGGFMAERES